MNIALGRAGFRLAAVASLHDSVAESYDSHELRAEVVVESTASKAHFASLDAQKTAIEKEVGEPLTWHPPEKKMGRIYVRTSANIQDRQTWPEQHEWLLQKLEIPWWVRIIARGRMS